MSNSLYNEKLEFVAKWQKPLCMTEKGLLTYKKHSLYLFDGTSFSLLLRLEKGTKEKIIDCSRVLQRIMRAEPQSAVAYGTTIYVAMHDSIKQISLSQKKVVDIHHFRHSGIHTSRMSVISGIQGFDDCVAYGEYFNNKTREKVCIYHKTSELDGWRCAYEFPEKSVRHIHALVPSVQEDCVYILTGDEDGESGIWKATDNFKQVAPLLVGTQEYRACIAFTDDKKITYATDVPSRQNQIVLYDSCSGKKTVLKEIEGTCTSGCRCGNQYVFGTTVEVKEPKKRSGISRIKYFFSKELAEGILDACPRLYAGNETTGYKEIICMEKDFWPSALCQFGRIQPVYDGKDRLYIYPCSVKKYDGKLFFITLNQD